MQFSGTLSKLGNAHNRHAARERQPNPRCSNKSQIRPIKFYALPYGFFQILAIGLGLASSVIYLNFKLI